MPDLVMQLEVGTEEYRRAATELSKRIHAFEGWLNKLPGKVAASCWQDERTDGQYGFVVRFARDGRAWSLYHSIEHEADDEPVHGPALLRDADVETKLRAVEMFPLLLANMRKFQTNFVNRTTKATERFDEFAKFIGIEEGE
jgi:hypothetical protein